MTRIKHSGQLTYGDEVVTMHKDPVPPPLRGAHGTVVAVDYYNQGLVLVRLDNDFEVNPGGTDSQKEPYHDHYFTFQPRSLWRNARSIVHDLPSHESDKYTTDLYGNG